MNKERFEVVQCEGPDNDLWIIWDREEEQVIDVMTTEEAEAYNLRELIL